MITMPVISPKSPEIRPAKNNNSKTGFLKRANNSKAMNRLVLVSILLYP